MIWQFKWLNGNALFVTTSMMKKEKAKGSKTWPRAGFVGHPSQHSLELERKYQKGSKLSRFRHKLLIRFSFLRIAGSTTASHLQAYKLCRASPMQPSFRVPRRKRINQHKGSWQTQILPNHKQRSLRVAMFRRTVQPVVRK